MLCAILVVAAPVSAQVPVVAYDGSEIFCHILKHFKFEPIPSIEALAEHKAEDTLIVIFGDLESLEAISKQAHNLDEYALLLASDHPTGRHVYKKKSYVLDSRLDSWKLLISSDEVGQPEADAYKGQPRCPFLKPDLLSRDHAIFRDVSVGLATNRPKWLFGAESRLHLLASFPSKWTWAGVERNAKWNPNIGYIFGTKSDSDQRTLILAGHGVFMNGMIAQSDNDNGIFAINTVRWLRDGPDGRKRKYALMIHDGQVIETFGLPLTGMPPVPIPPVRVINRMLRELENEGIAHRFIEEVVGWTAVRRFGLLAITAGLFLYGAWRLIPNRHRQESVPLVVGRQVPAAPVKTVMQQRQLELLGQDNLWEPAQALARQWFVDNAQVDPPLWDQADDAAPPQGQYRAGWWVRQKLSQQVSIVWSFAVRDPSQRVRLREFRKLADAVQTLDHAVNAGQLSFDGGKSSAG